jgi:hypothetical protein
MKLETHDGFYSGPAQVDDIARVVRGLTQVDKAYVILNDDAVDDETYVQAAGMVSEDFIIERRDGSAGEHYRGDRRVTADELITMLVGYLQGDSTWSHSLSWHRVRVDFSAANANA